MKRAFDITFSLAAVLVLLPVLAAVALAVVCDSRGGIFFLQDRIGKDGKTFRIFKFRTMIPNAENKGPLLAVRNDPRVTGVGKFLRRWSLDELPQLLNILKGEMSLVGPRPEIPPLVANYSPWQRQVLKVQPGLSGFAQVLGRDDIEMDTKLRLDAYYVRHRSFCMDIWIILKTVAVVIDGKGAF
ncbi:sugar transferase [candidate division TA06 bacterium]|nr:sugar transferase [candidate division TA06 bacterium]